MAYDRTGTGRWIWIKTIGAADDKLEPDWLEECEYLLESVWFPKHPRSIRAGDLLIYYAAGHGVFPAVMEVVSDEVREDVEHPRRALRWPWRMSVRPVVVVPRLRDAPGLERVGLNPLRLRRQSHILLNEAEWEDFRGAFLPVLESS